MLPFLYHGTILVDMKGRFCDLCRKEIKINNMIPMEIQGENYVFDSEDCVRIFHKLNAVYGNILISE